MRLTLGANIIQGLSASRCRLLSVIAYGNSITMLASTSEFSEAPASISPIFRARAALLLMVVMLVSLPIWMKRFQQPMMENH